MVENYFLIPFAALLINLFVWSYIYAQKKNSPVNKAFLIYAAFLNLWLIGVLLTRLYLFESIFLTILKVQSIAWLSIAFWFLHFTYIFIQKEKDFIYYLLASFTIITIVISLTTSWIIEGLVYLSWGIDEVPGDGFIPAIAVVVVIPAFYALYLIWKKYKETNKEDLKSALMLLIVGSLITLVIGLLSNVVMPIILNLNLVQIAESGTLIQSLFIFRAVRKYHLFTLGVEEVAEDLFFNMKDAVIIADKRNNILQMNKSAEELFAVKQDDLKNKAITGILPQFENHPLRSGYEKRLDVNGITKYLYIMGSLIKESDLKDGKIIIIRDITANKVAEEKLLESRLSEKEMETSLKQKEVLVKETHHRVKNNLQIISSLLHIQSQNINDPQAVDVLIECQNRVKAMALIHERLYQHDALAGDNFANYIRQLVEYLINSYQISEGEIKFNIRIDEIDFNLDFSVTIGLILNELVSNAFKHAFKGNGKGELTIAMTPFDDNGIKIIVKDDGAGFPENVDFRNTESLGLKLVVSLVEQEKGVIELKRNKGTEFIITFAEVPKEKLIM